MKPNQYNRYKKFYALGIKYCGSCKRFKHIRYMREFVDFLRANLMLEEYFYNWLVNKIVHINNLDEFFKRTYPEDWIEDCFSWQHSHQGFAFWADMNELWRHQLLEIQSKEKYKCRK